jgi:hypothetical protein
MRSICQLLKRSNLWCVLLLLWVLVTANGCICIVKRSKGKSLSAANLMRGVQRFLSGRVSLCGEGSSTSLNAPESSIFRFLSQPSNRGGSVSNDCRLPTFAMSVREEGCLARIQCTSTLLRSPGTLSGITGTGTLRVICSPLQPFRFRKLFWRPTFRPDLI